MELRQKPVCTRKVIENQELIVEQEKWKVYSENRNRTKREARRKNRLEREMMGLSGSGLVMIEPSNEEESSVPSAAPKRPTG